MFKNSLSFCSHFMNNSCSAHIHVVERDASSVICIVTIVMERKLQGIIVYELQGLFGNANVTSTDVSFICINQW